MGATGGASDPPVKRVLEDEPYCFGFFQAVRLLWLIDQARQDRNATSTRSGLPSTLRFETRPTLTFPPSQLHNVEFDDATDPGGARMTRLTVSFLGLTGPQGVLPYHYTEALFERENSGNPAYRDPAPRAFFDIFNHRLISLFYEGWEKYHFALPFERGDTLHFLRHLLDLAGLGTAGLHNRVTVDGLGLDNASTGYYAGLIGQRPHSAAALESILTDHLGVDVQVLQLFPRWINLDPSLRCRIAAPGANNRLGIDTLIGDHIRDRQSSFRLVIGPLNYQRFQTCMPDAGELAAVARFVRFFVGPAFMFDFQLVLKHDDVGLCRLAANDASAARLGWTSWIACKNHKYDDDVADAVFLPADPEEELGN